MKRSALLLLGLAALAGCGLERPLEPPQGRAMPPAPRAAARAPTVDEMLAVSTSARPDRIDELLRRSEEREDDHFDLPPPDRVTEVTNDVGDAPQ